MNPKSIKIIPSSFTVNETINRLVTLLQINGATVYARINQQKELHHAGIEIKPYEAIIFGNPRSGGPLLALDPMIGLSLPLKIVSWEDEKDKVWIAYSDIIHLAERYNLPVEVTMPLDLGPVITKALQ